MHESALAKQLLTAALERAEQEGARRIRLVRGSICETEALSAKALGFHFSAHAKGTNAEGAELALELVCVSARCRTCGETYAVEHHVTLCPVCGTTDADLLGKTGLRIDALEVD